jgi:23S rRNA (adenine2503-C2)-methyltransferase
MKILAKAGRDDIAEVYIARTGENKIVEFVESLQPPLSKKNKWVLIISTLYGCPVKCNICDAGGDYQGKISYSDMLSQIDYLVTKRYPERKVPVKKFKIQFARMGEPAFNYNVIKVLKDLPAIYDAPGLIPCISTIAPTGCERFFQDLLTLKKVIYPERFQLQFSLHSTNHTMRNKIIPISKWDFKAISEYGKKFYGQGGKKITLNFALADCIPVDIDTIFTFFPAEYFFIKFTPVNPTKTAHDNYINLKFPLQKARSFVNHLHQYDYEAIISIGELEENKIGSNCGMYAFKFREKEQLPTESYNYTFKAYQD